MVLRLTGGTADLVFLDLPRRLAELLLAEARREPAGLFRVELGMRQSGLGSPTREAVVRSMTGSLSPA
jgi:hypothetical protein